jgi:hypothetical protein
LENLKGRDHLEDVVIDGNIMALRKIWLDVVDLINLAQDKD